MQSAPKLEAAIFAGAGSCEQRVRNNMLDRLKQSVVHSAHVVDSETVSNRREVARECLGCLFFCPGQKPFHIWPVPGQVSQGSITPDQVAV